MEEVIWIEVLSRHRAVVSRHRCTGRVVRIGRAYTNDIILDDPYVAPEHACIVRDAEAGLVAEDLGTANGVHAGGGGKRLARLALGNDSVFRVGHTVLRVRTSEHAVAPERPMGRQAHLWPALLVCGGLVLGAEAASLWLSDFSELRAATYLVPLLGLVVGVTAWATIWSFISRIFTGQARLERVLLVTLAGALGYECLSVLSAVGAFGLSWSLLATYSYIAFYTLLAAVCFLHLHQINPTRSFLSGGVVAMLLLAAVTIQTVMQNDSRRGAAPLYVRNLLPPSLRLTRVENQDAFFTTVEKLRRKIDADRAEEP